MTTIIGIDPGLVHTGVVVMDFQSNTLAVETLVVETEYIDTGSSLLPDVTSVVARVRSFVLDRAHDHVFVEAYRPRGNVYSTDAAMRTLMTALAQGLPKAKVIDNTGMKFVVKQALMERLGVWAFATSTHHQDLRSAARIGLYGALKDDELNAVLFEYVTTTKETTHGHP